MVLVGALVHLLNFADVLTACDCGRPAMAAWFLIFHAYYNHYFLLWYLETLDFPYYPWILYCRPQTSHFDVARLAAWRPTKFEFFQSVHIAVRVWFISHKLTSIDH